MNIWLEQASWHHLLLLGTVGAALFELLTCLCRFRFGLRAAHHTSWLATITFGLRVHHGFTGLLLLFLAVLPFAALPCHLLAILGLALFLSDLVHHSVVLPLAVWATEFDLFYRR